MNLETVSPEKKNILELTYHEEGKIRLSLSESQGSGPIAFYQENEIAMAKIDGLVGEIIRSLNKINALKNPGQHLLVELQKSCQLLYEDLLSEEIKLHLQSTHLKDLELILDEQLVHIPWELLFDGQKFLCEEFNLGRQVKTRGSKVIRQQEADRPKSPLNMLIITDPTEDLEVAWKEGVRIYEEFQPRDDLVRIVFQSGEEVDSDFVRKSLWDYDLVHYAGHADHDSKQPDHSGWVLSDGKLRALDILKMSGSKRVMPSLIFANACQSGYTDKWLKENNIPHLYHHNYGLVYAFLMAGVKHYLGTFCEVSDQYGAYMGLEFYRQILKGKSIGEALRGAREIFREKYGEVSFSWTNYVLYGHPGDYLISSERVTDHVNPNHNRHGKENLVVPRDENGFSTVKPQPAASMVRHSQFPFPGQEKWINTAIRFFLLLMFSIIGIFFLMEWLSKERVMERLLQREDGQVVIASSVRQKRIEELKRMIYEKLKDREEVMPSQKASGKVEAQVDNWTSGPLVIAIFAIFDKSEEELPDWSIRIVKELERKLTRLFVEDARTRVAERKELDKLLEEKDLELSDFSFGEQKEILGRLLYANVMLFLNGYRASDGLSLCYKLVDAQTGEIDKINSSLKLAKKEKPEDLAQSIYLEARKVIEDKFPLRGRIVAVPDDLVVLNIGAEVGVRGEDIFEVFDSDDEHGKMRRIGKIKALGEAIEQGRAQCEILEGKEFTRGLQVQVEAMARLGAYF